MSCRSYKQGAEPLVSKIPNNESIFFSGIDDSCKCNISNYNYWTEIIVNGDVKVPDIKPSIDELDSVNVKLQIIRQKVVKTPAILDAETGLVTQVENLQNKVTTGRKLIIEGLVCLSISYLAKTCESSLHTFHGFIPFSAYIVVPQFPEPCLNLDAIDTGFNIISCVESVVIKEYNDREVLLCVPFVLQAVPTGTDNSECLYGLNAINPYDCTVEDISKAPCLKFGDPIIKGICSEQKIENIIKSTNDNLWVEMFVPEILTLPECKPSLGEILSLTSKVDIMCMTIIGTPTVCVPSYEGLVLTGRKLIIEAILRQRITYTSLTPGECESIHSAHFDVPISTFIVLPPDAGFGDKYIVNTCIEDIFVCATDERTIFKNTTLFFKASPVGCNNLC